MTKTHIEKRLKSFSKDLKNLKTISDEIIKAAHIDNVFWQVQAIIRENDNVNKADIFQQWVGWTYIDSISIRLRRLTDRNKGTISVWRLLESMKTYSELLTRKRYIDICDGPVQHLADEWFDSIAGKAADHVSKSLIEEKQKFLEEGTSEIKNYTNTYIAHQSRKQSEPPTFEQVRRSLVVVFRVFQWCVALLKCENMITPVPSYMSNWTDVFRVPWLRPGQPVPDYKNIEEWIRQENDSA